MSALLQDGMRVFVSLAFWLFYLKVMVTNHQGSFEKGTMVPKDFLFTWVD